MDDERTCTPTHPQGEIENGNPDQALVERGKAVDTLGGKVFVRWDPDAAVTAFGPVTILLNF